MYRESIKYMIDVVLICLKGITQMKEKEPGVFPCFLMLIAISEMV